VCFSPLFYWLSCEKGKFESRLALFLFSEDPGFAGSFIFVYKNEKAGSEEPAIHGTIRSAPFS